MSGKGRGGEGEAIKGDLVHLKCPQTHGEWAPVHQRNEHFCCSRSILYFACRECTVHCGHGVGLIIRERWVKDAYQ